LAWVFPWYYGLLFFLGALVALLFERRKPKLAEEFTLPIASGVVAGGSLMGVVLVFWANGGSILNKLLGGLRPTARGFLKPRVAADRRNDTPTLHQSPPRGDPEIGSSCRLLARSVRSRFDRRRSLSARSGHAAWFVPVVSGAEADHVRQAVDPSSPKENRNT